MDYIEVKDEILDKTFRFPCDRWLAKNDDDGQIMRELACANDGYLDLNEKTSKAGTTHFKDVFANITLLLDLATGVVLMVTRASQVKYCSSQKSFRKQKSSWVLHPTISPLLEKLSP